MSFNQSISHFETATQLAQAENSPAVAEIAQGLLEMAKAMNAMKQQISELRNIAVNRR